MTNPPRDLPAHTGSRTTRLLGAAVLVGVGLEQVGDADSRCACAVMCRSVADMWVSLDVDQMGRGSASVR